MNRSKFFKTITTAFLGTAAGLSIPFLSIKNFSKKNKQSVKVEINPLAVKREKKRTKNV